MSTVDSTTQCEQCGGEAWLSFCTRRRSTEVTCHACGYFTCDQPVLDLENNFVMDDDGHPCWEHVETRGFGVYCYKVKGSVGAIICGMQQDDSVEMKAVIEQALANGEIEPSPLYLTRWNEHANQVELVLGSLDDQAGLQAPVEALPTPIEESSLEEAQPTKQITE